MRLRRRHISCRIRGVSLIETLCVVSMVTVLLAIALPALRSARVSAGRTAMLSNLHGVGLSFQNYTSAFAETYPFHESDEWYRLSPPGEPGGQTLSDDPWLMSVYWPSVFHSIAPWREHYRTWINPGREVDERAPWSNDFERGIDGTASYRYSCSFLARPEAWPVDQLHHPPATRQNLLRQTRTHEVAFPALKAMCFDGDQAYLRRASIARDPRGVLASDGSASLKVDASATAPIQNVVNDRPAVRYHDTPAGIRGRDFQ